MSAYTPPIADASSRRSSLGALERQALEHVIHRLDSLRELLQAALEEHSLYAIPIRPRSTEGHGDRSIVLAWGVTADDAVQNAILNRSGFQWADVDGAPELRRAVPWFTPDMLHALLTVPFPIPRG